MIAFTLAEECKPSSYRFCLNTRIILALSIYNFAGVSPVLETVVTSALGDKRVRGF
ncbi:MAG TPA: hypothetical protein VFR78_24295 [Pyrinomonadaceae bacterium]|nr:hypothetical protein [Pyrinomonadaceae bacterium]